MNEEESYTLERYLASIKNGQWFGFSNHNDKSYKNLIIHSVDPKPTEQECIDGVAAMQAEYDAQEYARSRKTDYPDIGDQLDALYHAGVFPANMAARIKETKDKYPK